MKLRRISPESYELYYRDLESYDCHSRPLTNLPDHTFYAAVDDSGLGVRGLFVVREGQVRLCSFSTDKDLAHSVAKGRVYQEFAVSEEHLRLQSYLKKCPFELYLFPGCSLMVKEFPINLKGPEFKSFLVEHNYTEQDFVEFVKGLSQFKFDRVLFVYSPEKGLHVPGVIE